MVQEVKAAGGEASFTRCDVTKEADIKAAVDFAVQRYGRLDVAFNNAGAMGPNGPTHEQSGDALTAVLDLNVKSVYLCIKVRHAASCSQLAALSSCCSLTASLLCSPFCCNQYEVEQFMRQMQTEPIPDISKLDHRVQPNSYHQQAVPYSIVNNASIFGQTGIATYSAYAATKHAVLGITKSAAVEYAKSGIRINAVNYGFIISEIVGKTPVEWMVGKVPAGRLGQGVEAAECVAWLASQASSFVTGTAITCDGGVTSCSL